VCWGPALKGTFEPTATRIITLPEFTSRQLCSYDFGHERWNIEREQLIQYFNSEEYKENLNNMKQILKKYFNK